MKQIDERNYLSDEGKVFIQKETDIICGWGICLGLNDSIQNYEEIDCPEQYKGNNDYDNTVKEEESTPSKEQKTININGKPYKNKAQIVDLCSFSSHMQRKELINYYKSRYCLAFGGAVP